MGISDAIERFILSLFSEGGTTELQRNELAQRFGCAPSQINYVLSTRFTEEKGYVIQSRRGGGGYIRVVRVQLAVDDDENLLEWVGDSLDQASALGLIDRMKCDGWLTGSEAHLCAALLSQRALPYENADEIRATLCKAMLAAVFTCPKEGSQG